MEKMDAIILGAGMTGLAAGFTSGKPVYEALELPGGICSSYYIEPGSKKRQHRCPEGSESYRFEIGGGHWIFGGDPVLNHFIRSLTDLKLYDRRSSVYFHQSDIYVPYPLQNHLSYLSNETARKALTEMTDPQKGNIQTMADWLVQSFGATLTDLFFGPFHELYTAGLWKEIAPQDSYKSPVNIALALQGAFEKTPPVGYNTAFLYPLHGLDTLARELAAQCNVKYQKRAVEIDIEKKVVQFSDGSSVQYQNLISTLPLNRLLEMAGLELDETPAPYSSVLVLNVGAKRGKRCPDDHWLYNPDAASGFHRVGFYSNVDSSFLPQSSRKAANRVSIYVERAYRGSQKPSQDEIEAYAQNVARELQRWEYIEEAEVLDPTWIDVAYTWSSPGSNWKENAIQKLQKYQIYPTGRYAQWSFKGIANSIRDGFVIGSAFKNS